MKRPAGLFVTGTDTEVGKTVVSAGLLLALRGNGLDAGYCKPVGTDGLEVEGRLVNPDALWLRDIAGLDDPLAALNPFCLRNPLSPLAAGRLENVSLSLPEVVAAVKSALSRHAFTVVEGVGGLLVPLAEGITVLDLMAALKLPALVVGRPGLGTINHCLLTIAALKSRGIEVAGFCFSGAPSLAAEDGLGQNAGIITEFSGVPFWGSLPYVDKAYHDRPDHFRLAELTREHLDLSLVFAWLA